jgi:RsiW-degrading membrane proteinase PrsW (M82 family)
MTPGWYRDPWNVGEFRWWDGTSWTANVATPKGAQHRRRPRLPAWLSLPVIVGAVGVVPFVVAAALSEPLAVLLTLVPLAIVIPVLLWIDAVEPEPWSGRLHALLWGATISVLVAGTVNTLVAVNLNESLAIVVSAPLSEELMKGLGVLVMVRRREIDGVMDGLVYAGWVALGFAMTENVQYFVSASEGGVLAETFVLRALITPFAHPLFTAWIGLAVGRAVMRGGNVKSAALIGGVAAVGLHVAWNGSLVASERIGGGLVAVAALVFVGIFVGTIIMLVKVRNAEQQRYVEGVGLVMMRYSLAPGTVPITSSWRELKAIRSGLSSEHRRILDRRRAALARLVALHARTVAVDAADEARLVAQLAETTQGGPSS